MITREDLQHALEAVATDDRRRQSTPPTADEMLAYALGELSAPEEARVRELLLLYPELAEAMNTPFPDDDALPGEDGYLSPAEVDRHWTEMQARIGMKSRVAPANVATPLSFPSPVAAPREEHGRVLQFWRVATAIAAMLFLVCGGLLVKARNEARSLAQQLSMPKLASERQLLFPEGRRGGSDAIPTLVRDGDAYLLSASLGGDPYPQYRVEIVDALTTPPQTRWTTTTVFPPHLDTFSIVIPHTFLKPGRYEMVLYGVSGSRVERLSSFAMRVPAE